MLMTNILMKKKETIIGNFNYTVGMSVKMMRNEIQVQKHVYL